MVVTGVPLAHMIAIVEQYILQQKQLVVRIKADINSQRDLALLDYAFRYITGVNI